MDLRGRKPHRRRADHAGRMVSEPRTLGGRRNRGAVSLYAFTLLILVGSLGLAFVLVLLTSW